MSTRQKNIKLKSIGGRVNKSTGACEDLKDNVFILAADGKATDRFVKTWKAIKLYIQATFSNGQDVYDALEAMEPKDLTRFLPVEPEREDAGETEHQKYVKKTILDHKIKEYVRRETDYNNNMNKAYALILGQCTPAVKVKLEHRADWEDIKTNHDPIALIKAVKQVTHNLSDKKYPVASICHAFKSLFTIRQAESESLNSYYQRFQNTMEIAEILHGKLGMEKYVDYLLEDYEEDEMPEEEEKAKMKDQGYNRLVAYLFLEGIDHNRTGNLLKDLNNNYAFQSEQVYPVDLPAAVEMVVNYKKTDTNKRPKSGYSERDTQGSKNKRKTDDNSAETQVGFAQGQDKRVCYNCNKPGHLAANCDKPKKKKSKRQQGTANATVKSGSDRRSGKKKTTDVETDTEVDGDSFVTEDSHLVFGTRHAVQLYNDGVNLQSSKFGRLRDEVLLDNQSTTDIFCNSKYLKNIRGASTTLQLNTNGGVLICNQQGDVPGYGTVWYHPDAITNIISLSNAVDKGHKVTYDESVGFTLTNAKSGRVNVFRRAPNGLYSLPLDDQSAFIQSVEDNKKLFTKRQVEGAERAKQLYEVIGFPSWQDLKTVVRMNQIKNCPITLEDIKVCEKIFGLNIAALKGKTTRSKPPVVVNDWVEVPRELKLAHQGIILCADILFIEEIPFLMTVSKHLKFITIRFLPNQKKDTIAKALDETFVRYNKADFEVKELHADPEFECLREELAVNDIELNCCAAQEHQSDAERTARTIKERYRALYHSAPYGMWPKIMVIRGASYAVKWLNTFPPAGGISQAYSPRTIITGRTIDYDKHCKIPFGQYVQAVTQNEPSNTPLERTIDGIYLRTLDNIQGGYEVLNLKTGKTITRHKVYQVPVTPGVIKRVEQLAAKDGFKPHNEPIFKMYTLLAGVDDDKSKPKPKPILRKTARTTHNNKHVQWIDDDPVVDVARDELEPGSFTPGVAVPEVPEQQLVEQSIHDSSELDDSPELEPDDSDDEDEVEDQEPEPVPEPVRRSPRASKPPILLSPTFRGQSYEEINHLITQVPPADTLEYSPEEVELLAQTFVQLMQGSFAQQYSYKKGLKKFGQKGLDAAVKELKQLHGRTCFKPRHPNELTPQQRRKAMESLMLLTEKRDGTIKGRKVADGSKQRTWMSKDEAASPTVALESLFLTAIIDAKENREVAIVDLPNAFIQTENELLKDHHDLDIMKVRGSLAEMLAEIDPKCYGPYLTKENGISVLYLEILRAMYGMIKSPLLFYRKLRRDLESIGFKLNPYDMCVANKMVKGQQLTVVWHVDDLKVSHVNKKVVDEFIEWARAKYEDAEITKLKPSRGKVHDYLGITLDYSVPGKVKIYMKEYIGKMLEEFPYKEELMLLKKVSTPAAEHLFTVNPKAEKLAGDKPEVFHTTVAKNLFLTKRARPDLQPTVPFLCTRVQAPDVDDWKKLLRMLKYLQQTKDLELTLEAAQGEVILCKWYPDAAFAVHHDFKSHTGAILTLGKGAANTISAKQKLNTRSSTEAELVGADDVLPQALWTRNFLKEQGYESQTTIYQDNTSAILLEKNGTESSSKRTRHINIRHYFIKDCVDKNYLTIEYCPTDDMVGDFPSKALQGHKFKKHRKTIMNLEHEPSTVGQQECVRDSSAVSKGTSVHLKYARGAENYKKYT